MAAGRDENGRFKKGEFQGGPGRPPKAREENFLALIDAAVTDEDWTAIVRKACDLAKRGDPSAREWITNRRWGKVKEQVDANLNGEMQFIWQPHKPS